jgi:hypothetical protein
MKKVTILLEVQGKDICLFVGHQLIKTWKKKYTNTAGQPLDIARLLESVFAALHIPCEIELGEGFEDLADLI